MNQRLLEVQSQVEELQKSLQDQGSKAEDVSFDVLTTMGQEFIVLRKPVTFIFYLGISVKIIYNYIGYRKETVFSFY